MLPASGMRRPRRSRRMKSLPTRLGSGVGRDGPHGCKGSNSGMDIRGPGWSGTRTDRAEALEEFYQGVLGLDLVYTEPHP